MHRPPLLRLGAVTYLNARPLTRPLRQRLPAAEVRFDVPSRLAEELAAGDVDVALIPSVEAFRLPGCRAVSDVCIASRGEVLSVKLLCRVPVARIRRLAIDAGSRTSAAMTRIVLRERYGIDPVVESLAMHADYAQSDADAVMLIGDRAMTARDCGFAAALDMGKEWSDLAGSPMVYAMWTVRRSISPEVAAALATARDDGLAQIDEIVAEAGPELKLPVALCREYLKERLQYRLGPAEQEGLKHFYELAVRHGFAPSGVDLDAFDPAVA